MEVSHQYCLFCGRLRTEAECRANTCTCGFASGPWDDGVGHDRAGRRRLPRFAANGEPLKVPASLLELEKPVSALSYISSSLRLELLKAVSSMLQRAHAAEIPAPAFESQGYSATSAAELEKKQLLAQLEALQIDNESLRVQIHELSAVSKPPSSALSVSSYHRPDVLGPSDDMMCCITAEIPLDPVRFKKAKAVSDVYERSALERFFQDQQSSERELRDPRTCQIIESLEVDYVSAAEDVYRFVELHAREPAARDWIFRRLTKLGVPERETNVALLRFLESNKGFKFDTEHYGVTPGTVLRISGGPAIFFTPEPVSEQQIHKGIELLKRMPGIRWVRWCKSVESPAGMIAVEMESLTMEAPTEALVSSWAQSPFIAGLPLVMFQRLVQTVAKLAVPLDDRGALVWWKQHERAVLDLFRVHSELLTAFVGRRVRGGKEIAEIALVLVVRCKGFVPFDESYFPTEFHSLPVDVRSGTCSHASAAHSTALGYGKVPPYIGESIGNNSPGSIGGFVWVGHQQCALTAAHVVSAEKSVSVPAMRDCQQNPLSFLQDPRMLPIKNTFIGPLTLHEGELQGMEVTVDAALLLMDPPVEAKTSFVRKNYDDWEPADETGEQYIQTCSSPLGPTVLGYFGRTSGPIFNCTKVGPAHAKLIEEPRSQDDTPRKHLAGERWLVGVYQNQYLIERPGGDSYGDLGGDSGSCLWQIDDHNLVNPVGLVSLQASVESVQFITATPIQAVCTAMNCSFNCSTDLSAKPSSSSAVVNNNNNDGSNNNVEPEDDLGIEQAVIQSLGDEEERLNIEQATIQSQAGTPSYKG